MSFDVIFVSCMHVCVQSQLGHVYYTKIVANLLNVQTLDSHTADRRWLSIEPREIKIYPKGKK